jgi:hypothetical protein
MEAGGRSAPFLELHPFSKLSIGRNSGETAPHKTK